MESFAAVGAPSAFLAVMLVTGSSSSFSVYPRRISPSFCTGSRSLGILSADSKLGASRGVGERKKITYIVADSGGGSGGKYREDAT